MNIKLARCHTRTTMADIPIYLPSAIARRRGVSDKLVDAPSGACETRANALSDISSLQG